MVVTPKDRTLSPTFSYVLLFLALAATIAPFWTVAFPPSTDLPQHLAQIVQLTQTLAGQRPDLVVTPWYYPNTLVYLPIWIIWQFADPVVCGKLTLSLLAAAWTISAFISARQRNRPILNWLIGVPLTFNFLFSWGLLNFLCGWPFFLLFLSLATAPTTRKSTAGMIAAGLLLYYAHSLWFLAANAWLFVHLIDRNRETRICAVFSLVPAWLLAFAWYPQLAADRAASGVNTGVLWTEMPFARLDLKVVTDAALGAIHGPLENVFLIFLMLWVTTIIVTTWRSIVRDIDKPLFTAALLLGLAFWSLPSAYMNTVLFNARWLPSCLVLLLLSLPAPNLNARLLAGCGVIVMSLFSIATICAWRDWDREESAGLATALQAIHSRDKIIGFDFYGSAYVKGRPNQHAYAWAQAMHGSELSFSFTEHYSGAVQYREKLHKNPTRSRDWSAWKGDRGHLQAFDLVLVNANQETQDLFREKLGLTLAENSAPIKEGNSAWRLYRILKKTASQ